MLNSRESLLQRLALLGDGTHKDLLVDLVDSAWQWSRKDDSTSTRNRKTIIGGQVSSSSSQSTVGGGPSSGSNSSGSGGGASSQPMQQIQSDWKVSDPTSVAFIKNKPDLSSIIDHALSNSPYAVWWSNAEGRLVGTQAFTFGDPSRLGALYVPSLQAIGSIIVGNKTGFWDDQFFTMDYSATGGTVQLTPGYSNTKFIYAHNNSGNASVVTDKASFANLQQNGIVFASLLPNTSEDLIYLHTDAEIQFNPTTKTFTIKNISCKGNADIPSLRSILVNKQAHEFSLGQPLHLGVNEAGEPTWSLAQSTSDLSLIATHFVVEVIDNDSFRASCEGYWKGISMSSYGQIFLGSSPGSVISSISSLPSNVAIQPLGIADNTGLHINITSYVRDVTP